MVYFIPNIISELECNQLVSKFKKEQISSKNIDLYGSHMVNINSTYGFKPSKYFDFYLEKLKLKVESYIENKKITSSNTFIREYKNKSYLNRHVDRDSLDVTLSICLYNDTDINWPLYVKIKNDTIGYNTNVGDGILLTNATSTIHWRDELNCNDNLSIIQFFLHWSLDDLNKKRRLL
jgi:hypothetical protein